LNGPVFQGMEYNGAAQAPGAAHEADVMQVRVAGITLADGRTLTLR
jgi:hypothetical protein